MATNLVFNAIVPEVLTENNYANWSVCVESYLVGQDLWDIIKTESKPEENEATFNSWRKKNAMALHVIQISCGPEMLSQIREIKSAKEAWDYLAKINNPQSHRVNKPLNSSEANSVSSSSGTTASLFGCGWQQPGKSPIVGSTFNSTSPSVGFSSGGFAASFAASNSRPMMFSSSTAASMGSVTLFTSSASGTGSESLVIAQSPPPGTGVANFTQSMPIQFGSSASAPTFGLTRTTAFTSGSSGFDSSIPATKLFSSGPRFGPSCKFGSTAASGVNPFQFGSQQNPAMPQNPSPFPSSGSREFNAGGSFSLSTGGGDKSGRKMIKVRKSRKK